VDLNDRDILVRNLYEVELLNYIITAFLISLFMLLMYYVIFATVVLRIYRCNKVAYVNLISKRK